MDLLHCIQGQAIEPIFLSQFTTDNSKNQYSASDNDTITIFLIFCGDYFQWDSTDLLLQLLLWQLLQSPPKVHRHLDQQPSLNFCVAHLFTFYQSSQNLIRFIISFCGDQTCHKMYTNVPQIGLKQVATQTATQLLLKP